MEEKCEVFLFLVIVGVPTPTASTTLKAIL
jgi:hypothetical protein